MEPHELYSADGIHFSCPICGREYTVIGNVPVVIRPGNEWAQHRASYGMRIIDITTPVGPTKLELFRLN